MPITSSTFATGHLQADGRRHVVERHTDNNGIAHMVEYLADALADHQAVMAARAVLLAQSLADREFDDCMDSGAIVLTQQAAGQFAARLRQRYLTSSGQESGRIAQWIMDRLDAGQLTEAQMRTAFSLTLAQWTALKARLATLRTNYNAVMASKGE